MGGLTRWNSPQPLAFFLSICAARSLGYYYLSFYIQKLNVLVSACANNLAVIASLNGGHTLFAALLDIKKQNIAEGSPG